MNHLAVRLLTVMVRFYQLVLSPWLGPVCRFQPTCSEYTIDAVHQFGIARGSWFAIRRLRRCHPLGGSGYDPIPNRVVDGS
jgi:putative membrane protein insertion efficiency factor